ncbi:MAG: hypothetical protein ACI9OE_000790 [Mariniflexile sp.]|jgi:hypothetical protein
MKTSIVILSSILILSVFLPFLLFVLNGTKNTASTKKHINSLLKDNGIVYGIKEIWRKSFIGISDNNNILTYVYFELGKPTAININVAEIKQCHVIKNYNYDKKKIASLKSQYLELSYKSSSKLNTTINFYNVDDDLSEDFELQRIEKWHKLITSLIPEQQVIKKAS